MKPVHSILVIAPHWVGDSLFFLPAVDAVKRKFPAAAVDLLAKPSIAALHLGPGRFQAVHTYGPGGRLGRFKAQWALRGLDYDLALVFPDSTSAAIGAWLTGAKVRVGRRGQTRGLLLTPGYRLPPRDRERHVVDEYLDLARALAAEAGEEDREPRLAPPTLGQKEQVALFKERGLEAGSIIGLCPTSAYGPAKEWPLHHWQQLARLLLAQGEKPVVFCAPSELERIQPMAEAVQVPLLSPGLAGLAGCLAACKAVVANDSGPLHLAAALGRPCVGLFGPVSPDWSAPRSAKAVALSLKMECSPCYAKHCPLGHHKCLEDLAPTQVLKALR